MSPRAASRLELAMDARIAEIPALVERVEAFGLAHGMSTRVLHDIQVALDEVLSNIVSYAYEDATGEHIAVNVAVDPVALVVQVIDRGRPFNPLDAPQARASAPPRGSSGGLGIYFTSRLVDGWSYEREGDCNRLSLRKTLPGTPSD